MFQAIGGKKGCARLIWSRVKNKKILTCAWGSDQDHAEALRLFLAGSLGLDLGFEAVNLLVQLLEKVLDVAEGTGTWGGIVNRGHDGDSQGEEEWRVEVNGKDEDE